MAIFSQQKESTSIDFRNYDVKNPNRYVPFSIPKSIESKLKLFMKKLDLKTGSIDLIVTPNDEYVFLEVNPVGQFDFVSVNCNYYIEKEIAIALSKGRHYENKHNLLNMPIPGTKALCIKKMKMLTT